MLTSLTLHQFALISEHEIAFVDGFNVITGETGAGKSLLLDALSLCIGERADTSMIRHGADQADIYALFDVMDNPAIKNWFKQHERSLDEPELLIRRQLGSNGRSKSWVNGAPISLAELKSLGTHLVNIHSQHAQQALLQPQFVIDWLDVMAGTTPLAEQTKTAYHHYQKLKRQANDIAQAAAQRHDRMALLESQLSDVEPLLSVDYAAIEAEHDELSNLDALMQEAAHALQLLDNDSDEPDVMSPLGRAIKICDGQISMSPTFASISEQLYLAQQQIQEATSMLSDYAEQQLPDPERLNELNTLISLAHRLSRKYGISADALADEAKTWQEELESLINQPTADAMNMQVQEAWQDFLAVATKLNEARMQAASQVSAQLVEQLKPLALPNARCEFLFTPRSEDNPSESSESLKPPENTAYNAQGTHDVELLFSANVGMPMQPLHKIASGGELSRMALVMQVLQATNTATDDSQSMLVFDEVDVGISGGTAQVVGELLRQLGQKQQILAITHQAQVAAQAHQHILVQKHHEQQSESMLTILSGDAQIDELARMSGGVTITDITRDHARSLLSAVN